jgi:hypothetical protein
MHAHDLPILARELEPALRDLDDTVTNLAVRLDSGFVVAEWDGRLGRFTASCAASLDRAHLVRTAPLHYAASLRTIA